MPSIATLLGGSQNKAWAEDKTGFGFRMMEKMGWAEGKGLGKDENGMLTHVKMKKRAVELGIGSEVSDLRNKNFIEQQTSFSELLQSLAKEHGSVEEHKKSKKRKKEVESDSSSSEEEEEKPIKRKLPQKFQRGRVIHNKNVSLYSEADKAALFGVREKEVTIEDVMPQLIKDENNLIKIEKKKSSKEEKGGKVLVVEEVQVVECVNVNNDKEEEKKRLKKEKKERKRQKREEEEKL